MLLDLLKSIARKLASRGTAHGTSPMAAAYGSAAAGGSVCDGDAARRAHALYSAGELGSIYSYLYQGTGNIGECFAFGRIAARNAVAELPWDRTASKPARTRAV